MSGLQPNTGSARKEENASYWRIATVKDIVETPYDPTDPETYLVSQTEHEAMVEDMMNITEGVGQ